MSDLDFALAGCCVAILGALRAAWSPCGQSMLASLTPLGERSRGGSWRVTATAYAIGAIGAGALRGAGLGAIGWLLLPAGRGGRGVALLIVLAVAVAVDATPLRRRLPLTRRQVNEDWMARYRGWVYGIGFGSQLGLGFTTLAASAAIYATFACELLSASVATGALIGAVFGAVKALSLLPARRAVDHSSLVALHQRLIRLEPRVGSAVVVLELAAVLGVVGLLA